MKTIQNDTLSRNPIAIPDDADLDALKATRERLAKEIQSEEFLIQAKEMPEFQAVVMDSYLSMQMIERAAILLDPKKPDFAITFAGLQGRARERLDLTQEIIHGKRKCRQRRNLLSQLGDKIKSLLARLQAVQPMKG